MKFSTTKFYSTETDPDASTRLTAVVIMVAIPLVALLVGAVFVCALGIGKRKEYIIKVMLVLLLISCSFGCYFCLCLR